MPILMSVSKSTQVLSKFFEQIFAGQPRQDNSVGSAGGGWGNETVLLMYICGGGNNTGGGGASAVELMIAKHVS